MKTKRKVIRNFIYKGKRKRVEDGPIESPIASEQEASFTFHTNDVRFSVWLLCLTLRYGEHLSKSFDVDWCDAEDQSGTPLESLIKVSHLPDRDNEVLEVTTDGIESNSSDNQDEISSNLYTITVYKSKNKFMIQGNCRYHWVEREFTEIKRVVDEYLSQSDNRNSTLISCYNQVFEAELELDILDSSDNIQEDEVSNFDDRVIDKNFSKVTAEQEKPKPTRKKTVKKSTSTPLKRLTKRRSTKPSLANPNKRNGKPTSSDLELSVLNQKIGNIESILERLDLKVAEVNASYIESKTELIKTVDDSLNRFMKDTINRIELLESRNKELEEKINNIGICDNIVKLSCDNEIRIIVEEVFKKNIDTFIKDSHEIITASLNEVVDKEFQSIQSEKRELMSLFEDFKVRNNKEFDAQKLQMDQIVQEIDALKRSDFDCETNIKTDKDIKSTDEKIRITAEKVFNNNIDSYVKVSQQRIIEKLNEVAEKKIQTIQSEKIELVSLFEDFKVRQKNDWTTQKLLMDEVVQELHSGVSKSIENRHIKESKYVKI